MKHDHSQFALRRAYASADVVEKRVRDFLPMVQRAAWHIHGMGREGVEIDDLIQAGMVALTECAQRHQGPGEDGFAAYAKMRVRGAMFDLLRRTMPASRGAAQRQRRYEEAREQLAKLLGRPPGAEELARQIGCTIEELREIEAASLDIRSIEESYEESNLAFADPSPDPFEMLASLDDRERLAEAIAQLPERLQLVLQLFFVEELNLTEIAQLLEVSVPRVHQLRAQALGKLRAIMAG